MKPGINEWEATSKRNIRHLAYWTFGWVVTLAIPAFGSTLIWNHNPMITIIFISINTIMGIGMLLINRKYINALDEMQRKINMDAMAIALGVGVVGGMSYTMLDITNIISFDAEISHLAVLISITYFVAIVVGQIRYK